MTVTLDGEVFSIRTLSQDQLKAEEALGREKRDVMTSPLALQLRVAYFAFSREYPEHPLARNWSKFSEVFDDIDDLEAEAGNVMDPTQEADWES